MDETVESKSLDIQYFAILREQAKAAGETVNTAAKTPSSLYEELRKRHCFTLESNQLRVAVNNEFVSWDKPLNTGDVIVFIPPVAGG